MKFFFDRGNGPLVSVLICSRGRSAHLLQALDSLWSLAVHKHDIEFIIKADDDDQDTIGIVNKLMGDMPHIKVTLLVGPRGRGYHDIHLWTDWMCREAQGDWLFIFNDDARMKTEKWDDLLMRLVPPRSWPAARDVCLMVASTIDRPFAQEFLILRRKTYQLLGSVGDSPHADNWLYSIAKFLDVVIFPPITVEHLSGQMADDIRAGSVDAYKTTITTLNSTAATRKRCNDTMHLLEYMERSEARAPWQDTPLPVSDWVRWRKSPDHPQSCMFLCGDGSGVVLAGERGLCVAKDVMVEGGQWASLDGCGIGGN